MRHFFLFAVAAMLITPIPVSAGVGESAVVTLIMPFGARSIAMGETGTSLANDYSALYFNPAGLGIRNEPWRKASGGLSFGPLLPAFRINDLLHLSFAGYYQSPYRTDGIGVYCNYIAMGENTMTDALGREGPKVRSWESIWAAGWGIQLPSTPRYTQSIGLTFKYVISALAPGLDKNGTGIGTTVAFDAGYLGILPSGLRFGITLANMGPDIFYIDEENKDPIPFTLNAAVGYTTSIVAYNMQLLQMAAEVRLDKELVVNRFDGNPDPFYKAFFTDMANEDAGYEFQEINYHFGMETTFFNTLAWRYGLMIDILGQRYEIPFGFGIFLFNHFRLDYSYIVAPEGFMKGFARMLIGNGANGATGARDGQWQIVLSIDALAGWTDHDREWWKVNKEREKW